MPANPPSTSPIQPLFSWRGTPRRIDLHCHSSASNKTGEAALNAIGCPESYSPPAGVYEQARNRGMDFVTLTDHDTIAGAKEISNLPDVLVGEELTCWFPEDQCKMHVLVYGLDDAKHETLQKLAPNIYDVADFIEQNRIAHSVAHPIYRQNDRLDRWHLERLLLLFKAFECLNGAHSGLHRDAFEPVLDRLNKQEINRLSELHDLKPRWPEPWVKSRTAGSDDHGLLNIGRTWTEFPPDTRTVDQLLECLRDGNCRPGGEAGSTPKLAHTFYGVAVRYYTNKLLTPGRSPNFTAAVLQTIVGERPAPTKRQIVHYAIKRQIKKAGKRIIQPFRPTPPPKYGTAALRKLFLDSARKHFRDYPGLMNVLKSGLPPLGEHDDMFSLISDVNRDVTQGVAAALRESIDDASFTGLFDTIGAAIAQQFALLPYYFACFHQNKERHLLREITRQHPLKDESQLKIGLFTDTLDEINGVARFIRDMGEQAKRGGRQLMVHTCTDSPREMPSIERKNFKPLLSREMPYYSDLKLNLPPLLEILEWADRQQFDAIHVSTPGPMGLCGLIVSKMLRVPLLGTYHTDFPAYVDNFARDHRVTNATIAYMKWFYERTAVVFSRSNEYRYKLHDLDVPDEKLRTIQPGVNTDKFSPDHATNPWPALGVRQPKRLLYAGRVSVEKNLPFLAIVFERLCQMRTDTALVVAGDGPYLAEMKKQLAGLPAYFLGVQNDAQLGQLYASSDLFVFPSRTDTLGQVVMEAQASGLPVLVSDEGGPKEMMLDDVTGQSLDATNSDAWLSAIDDLLTDDARRIRLGKAAAQRLSQRSLANTFASFWSAHVDAIGAAAGESKASDLYDSMPVYPAAE
ncbi:MAG: glycosyltransferase [Phycisphaerae bacterium]|nr:glycosyltransferase [Phycisphaerae bacterium]